MPNTIMTWPGCHSALVSGANKITHFKETDEERQAFACGADCGKHDFDLGNFDDTPPQQIASRYHPAFKRGEHEG